MSNPTLSTVLLAKQKEGNLTIGDMAKAIGVNMRSVSAALKGKSFPNKSTAGKYAAYVGMSPEAFAELIKASGATAAPSKRGAKAGKTRKGGRKAKAGKGRKAKAPKGAGKAGRKAKGAGKSGSVTLAQAVSLAGDSLAIAVNGASAAQRRLITAFLAV